MVKAKSYLMTLAEDSLALETRPGVDLSGIDLNASPQNQMLVLRTKPTPSKTLTEKQQWQRSLYCDTDAFYRSMNMAQMNAWKQFYQDMLEQGKIPQARGKPRKDARSYIKTTTMNQRQYFFYKALQFNLEPFLSQYFKARWHVADLKITEQTIDLEARIVSTETLEPVDYLDEQGRLLRIRW